MLNGQIVGNLGSDPELQYSADGAPRIRFTVAANQRVKDQSGNWADKAEWTRVTVFGPRAESLSKILVKGTRVFVGGRLEARPWIDRSNNPQAGLEIVANDVELMSPRQDNDGYSRPTNTVNAPARAAAQGQSDASADLEDVPF